jgi:hypothetical protein
MWKTRARLGVRLTLERLEGREVPAVTASPWTLETFDQTAPGALPAGWQLHSSDGGADIAASAARALGSDAGFRADGSSVNEARAWSPVVLPADAQVTADIYLDSLVPAQVITRGRALDTSAPSYYAVSVTRGMQVQLLKVVDGQSTVLATLNSTAWLSNQWVRVSLTTVGNDLYVQVVRTDTDQYLGANGQWLYTATQAIHVQDDALNDGGNAGLARAAQYAGAVSFDNFMTAPPPADLERQSIAVESFKRPAPGGLPAGWAQWGENGSNGIRVSTGIALTESGSLRSVAPDSGAVRSWLDTDMPADAQVSAAVYLDGAAQAQIMARGQDLGTTTPTYYAAALTAGMQVQIQRVVAGQTTVLASLNSNDTVASQWVQATLSLVGDDLRVLVYRHDKGQYLNANGDWQVAPAWALEAHDSTIQGTGRAGLGRPAGPAGMVTFDSFSVTDVPTTSTDPAPVDPPPTSSDFDSDPIGSLPPGWSQWTNTGDTGFAVTDQRSLTTPHGLQTSGGSDLEARAWLTQDMPADVQVGSSFYLDSLVPAQLVVRGQGLDGDSPSYYAASVTRGLDLQLLRVQNGHTDVLSTLSSNEWDSSIWVRVNLIAQGNTLQVQVSRLDSGQYLNQDGDWQDDPAIAMSVTDSGLTGGGSVGLLRPASYSGNLVFDDFDAQALTSQPGGGQTSNDPPATPPDAPPTLPSDPSTGDPSTPPPTSSPGGEVTPPTPGSHPPELGSAAPPPSTSTPPPVSAPPANLPPIPRHYDHIRIAEFAYQGTPLGTFEQGLLQNSVDVVIPNTSYVDQISATAPNTPQFIYSNASNIYRELLTDWLNYADAHGYNREDAFFHVTQAQPFTGDSASSWPVTWFWNVYAGSDGSWKNVTSQAHGVDNSITFGGAGQSVMIGNTEQFREINFSFSSGARDGWQGVLEYATAVDANGNPTQWKTLSTISDGTAGFTKSGQVTFDPPSDWVTSAVNGGPQLYYVRVRTTADGTAPVATTILGRDYVNAHGAGAGVIPAFDKSADANGDGYLNDAEYANRRPGLDARFLYESRAFYPAYGQNRFATNVANAHFKEWAADYSYRFLQANPGAQGLFMDNSLSKIAFDPRTIAEPLDHYADNYAEVLAAINKRIAPKWVLANVAGGGVAVDALAKRGISYLEEFAIRPLAASYSQFEDVSANLNRRLDLSGGKAYAVLDSLATNGSMSDPRVQIATLAYYYLLADKNQTMLVFNGGNDPNSTWRQHWSDAVKYDVGDAIGTWSVFAKGIDPADSAKTYKVYERHYENALVLYKPLSYYQGKAGSTADATATTHQLDGTYRPLQADGTLGDPITKITLRNGEGAILVKV